MITLFLTGVVAMIMLRTLRKDISTYNEVGISTDASCSRARSLGVHYRVSFSFVFSVNVIDGKQRARLTQDGDTVVSLYLL